MHSHRTAVVAQTWLHRGHKGRNLAVRNFCSRRAAAACLGVPWCCWRSRHCCAFDPSLGCNARPNGVSAASVAQVFCPGHVPCQLLLRPEQQWGLPTLLIAVSVLWCPTQQGFPCLTFYRHASVHFGVGHFSASTAHCSCRVLHKGCFYSSAFRVEVGAICFLAADSGSTASKQV